MSGSQWLSGVPRIESQNYDDRPAGSALNAIVLHYTAVDDDISLRALTKKQKEIPPVSAHFLITSDGTCHQLVPLNARAWHCGKSNWKGQESLNSSSIGIEIVNDGFSPFHPTQIETLKQILRQIFDVTGLGPEAVAGHQDISPDRKIDPGPHFPWEELEAEGLVAQQDIEPLMRLWTKGPLSKNREKIEKAMNAFLRKTPEGETELKEMLLQLGYAVHLYGMTHCLRACIVRNLKRFA